MDTAEHHVVSRVFRCRFGLMPGLQAPRARPRRPDALSHSGAKALVTAYDSVAAGRTGVRRPDSTDAGVDPIAADAGDGGGPALAWLPAIQAVVLPVPQMCAGRCLPNSRRTARWPPPGEAIIVT